MFGMPQLGGMGGGGQAPLVNWKCGKMNLEGTTVTADTRKGLLILRKSEDGLMHLIWKDRTANSVVDDLIVFEGDASIRHLEACKDGYAMLLEFSQTARKLFFYSQEPRKKGLGWGAEDTEAEKELLDKTNAILTGGPAAAAPTAATGALGMTHSELMAMLGGAATVSAGAPAAAEAPSSGEESTSGAAASDPSQPAAPAPAAAVPPLTSAPPGASGGGTAAPFSADAISSILSGIPAAGAGAGAAGAPAFSADAISSILSGIAPAAPAAPPVALNDVLRPEETAPRVDAAMEAALAEHLPQSDTIPETATATLSTPQMAQASTDAEQAAKSSADAMETDTPKDADKGSEDRMDES